MLQNKPCSKNKQLSVVIGQEMQLSTEKIDNKHTQ